MPDGRMLVYQSPSGWTHRHLTCTGIGSRVRPVRMAEAEYAKAVKCQCLYACPWKADERRAPMAGLPAETVTP